LELYDLKSDLAESTNVAKQHPDVVARAMRLMEEARDEHPDWPLRDRVAKKK
jgi:hypothetical protein